ncbi:arylsulfatase [Tamlana sp. I1]|uniref:arylsulfatase n=1 Tax=Tamlana sp. I1 TaxID=2762061 RepID=UPI00188E4A21|nr:arylsulfatase [Tamlana sp. I1]
MIHKKTPFKVITLLILFLSFINCKNDKTAPKKAKHKLPNVIFILADDLGYSDLSCYGQKLITTPNIDALADNGIIFTQHYSGSSVCAPSRSTLLTGLHTGHTPIRGNKEVLPEGQYPIADSVYTLAEVFKNAGYTTGTFGKWGLGYPGSEGDPNNQGFDQFYGYNCQRLAHHYYPYFLRSNQEVDSLLGNKGHGKETYAPTIIHEKALSFIETNKDQPFFMFYPTSIPHAELAAPEKDIAKYRGKLLPENSYKGYDEGPEYRNGPYESQKETHATYAAMIHYLDNKVGEIVKKVNDLGLTENTIIIFTSDNGPSREGGVDPEYFNSNGPLKGFKRDLYEGGIRVPLIVSWPGTIKENISTNHISAFWDFMPTFSDILGQSTLNYPTDGISFLPTLLNQENQKQHDYLYWEFHEKGGRQAVRKGQWKAVKYNVLSEPKKPIELYDLSADLGETNDVSSKYPEITSELTKLIETSRTPSDVFQFSSETFLNSK